MPQYILIVFNRILTVEALILLTNALIRLVSGIGQFSTRVLKIKLIYSSEPVL